LETAKLISLCLEGDESAWKMIVNTYAPQIFNLAYHFTGSQEEAEDVTQEIFLKLLSSLKKYKEKMNFTAWLLTLTRNHLIDRYRREKKAKSLRQELDENFVKETKSQSPENNLARKETQVIVWQALDQLSPEIRLSIILFDILGKTYEEVAEILNIPVGTVKSRINRGRLQLARLLADRQPI
jgi:RNA polymerase sigma-70 factor (ECF subfamily)